MDRLVAIAEEAGYSSLSRFIADVLREVVAGYDAARSLGLPRSVRRRRVMDYVFSRFFRIAHG